MKILAFTDLHLHTYLKFGQKDSISLPQRLKEQEEVLDQIWSIIQEEQVDLVEFGGDWYHRDKEIPTECLNVTHRFFQRFALSSRHIYFEATRGNHDLVNKENPTPYQYSLAPFLFNTIPLSEMTNKIYKLHYDEAVDYDKIKGYDIVIAHKMPIGSKACGYTFDEGVDWKVLAKNNKLVLFGHNHHKQNLSANCIVMGSPMHLNFGDEGERGCYIIEDTKCKFIPLKSPKFITITEGKVPDNDSNYYRVIGEAEFKKASNIIVVKEPEYFESRIKSNTFIDVLKEWIKINEKDENYLEVIKEFINLDLLNLKNIPNLTLKTVSIQNFLSFEKASFSVEKGLNVIVGKNETFDSNGSGKSSTMEAIFWCLFGETTKGLTGDDVIRKYPEQQKNCKVGLLISSNKCDYKIIRSRKDGLEIYLQDHGVDSWHLMNEGLKQKESQQMLESILGFNSLIFTASTYFNQDQLLLLTRLGTAEKSGLITDLLGFESYDKLLTDVNLKAKDLELQKTSLERDIDLQENKEVWLKESFQGLIEMEKTLTLRALNKKKDLELLEVKRAALISKIEAYKEEQADTSTLDKQEKDLDAELKLASEDLAKLELKKKSLSGYKDCLCETEKACTNISCQISSYTTDINGYKRELSRLNKLKVGDICSYCGSKVVANHSETEIKELEKKIAEVSSQAKEDADKLIECQAEKLRLQADITSFESQLEKASTHKMCVQTQLSRLAKDRQRLLESKGEKDILLSTLEGAETSITSCNKELSQLKLDFISNKEKIKKNEGEIQTILFCLGQNKASLNNLTEDIETLSFWKEALSFKGIKSLLLDGFCNAFNNILKEYISKVSDGSIFCQFSPTSQTKSGEMRNKLDMIIEIEGVSRIYDSLSGGEKRRVDIAVCLSFSDWVRQQYNMDTSLLGIQIFDEIFSSLDSSGEDTVGTLLRELSSSKAMFCISHGKELSNYADREIIVSKKNDISHILNNSN